MTENAKSESSYLPPRNLTAADAKMWSQKHPIFQLSLELHNGERILDKIKTTTQNSIPLASIWAHMLLIDYVIFI